MPDTASLAQSRSQYAPMNIWDIGEPPSGSGENVSKANIVFFKAIDDDFVTPGFDHPF